MSEYRQSDTGLIYRRVHGVTQILTPWTWTVCPFFFGTSGWQLIQRFTKPVAINPTWPV